MCIVLTLILFSLKHPAKYVGRKPRKYTVPVPVVGSGEAAASLTGNPQQEVPASHHFSQAMWHPAV